jgi:hypothetical protein
VPKRTLEGAGNGERSKKRLCRRNGANKTSNAPSSASGEESELEGVPNGDLPNGQLDDDDVGGSGSGAVAVAVPQTRCTPEAFSINIQRT